MADPVFASPLRSFAFAPDPMRDWALFLDLDGTLLDLAATPDEVVVPDGLLEYLAGAGEALGGALAIVTGRPLATVDRLLAPLVLPVGCEHGAIIRLPNGTYDEAGLKIPQDWTRAIVALAARCPGVLTETKEHTIVAHFRNAPDHAQDIRDLVSRLVAHDPDHFEMLEAKMALEIRARAISKARAVHALMKVAPFAGRVPVFVGDDTTDEDGFRAAIEWGGIALDVGSAFADQPRKVRDWLKRFAEL